MNRAQIDATNPVFEKFMAWLWQVTDEKRDLEKLVPYYLARPTGAVHNPDLHLDREGNVWRYGRDEEGHCWTQLVRSDSTPLAPYRSTNKRVPADPVPSSDALGKSTPRPPFFIKQSSACLQEDWCWEIKVSTTTPFSRLQVNLTSHIKAIALGDLLLIKRDEITEWLGAFARSEDPRFLKDSLLNLYRQFCPGLEVDSTEMKLFYPEAVQEALTGALIKIRDLQSQA